MEGGKGGREERKTGVGWGERKKDRKVMYEVSWKEETWENENRKSMKGDDKIRQEKRRKWRNKEKLEKIEKT